MTRKHTAILFYVNLTLISLLNLTLICALFFHLILGYKQEQIEWLLGVFAVEILGCFVFSWHQIFKPKIEKAARGAREKLEITTINSDDRTFVISKTPELINLAHPDVIEKEKARELLKKARNKNFSREVRHKYAKQARLKFAQIHKDSVAYFSARYDMAIADRILERYQSSIKGFEKMKSYLFENKSRYAQEEFDKLLSETTMMIGTVYLEQGLLKKARFYFMESWFINPRFMTAVLNLFEVAFREKNIVEAEIWKEILSKFEQYPSISGFVENSIESLRNYSIQESAESPLPLVK